MIIPLNHAGDGERLQALLEQRAREQDSWLADWWQMAAYLSYRMPVVVHSNPTMVWKPLLDSYGSGSPQLRTTARVIFKLGVFHDDLFSGRIKDQTCMSQYPLLLGSCRIPDEGVDRIVSHGRDAHTV